MRSFSYREDLALVLLADAVASELDMDEADFLQYYQHLGVLPGMLEELRDRAMRPQEDICETLCGLCDDLGVDVSKALPLDIIDGFVAKINAAWEGKATVEDLYEAHEDAATVLVLGAAGHGTWLGDSDHHIEWLKERDLDEATHRSINITDSYYESSYALICNLIQAKVKQAAG